MDLGRAPTAQPSDNVAGLSRLILPAASGTLSSEEIDESRHYLMVIASAGLLFLFSRIAEGSAIDIMARKISRRRKRSVDAFISLRARRLIDDGRFFTRCWGSSISRFSAIRRPQFTAGTAAAPLAEAYKSFRAFWRWPIYALVGGYRRRLLYAATPRSLLFLYIHTACFRSGQISLKLPSVMRI